MCCCHSQSIHITSILQLAKNNRVHWIQAPFTYLQSSYNLLICITSSLFSCLAAPALHFWLHSLVHLHLLLDKEQIIPSSMLPLVSGINSRLVSINNALISPILIHLRVALLPLVSSTHHSHHPPPLHSFIPGLKPYFSANASHHSLPFLLQDWLHGFPGLLRIIPAPLSYNLMALYTVYHKKGTTYICS